MKLLAIATSAFLLAVPTQLLAQSSTQKPASEQQGATGHSSCETMKSGMSFDALPERCRSELDTWIMGQAGKSTSMDGDIAVGTVIPDNIVIAEAPFQKDYGYVMLNDKRVLVDRSNRTVIKVY